MNDAIFSTAGRLTRRDYVLTIAALFGGVSLLSFAAISALLSLAYFTATAFFREAGVTFWILFLLGLALIFTLNGIFLPLLAIPATVRRLHDIGHNGWLACPLVLLSILPVGLPVLSLFFLATLLEGMNRSPEMLFFDSPEELGVVLGSFILIYFILCVISLPILTVFAAWIFLKKGVPFDNRYGAPPVEEEIPAVCAAYFSQDGRIDRAHFIFRALVLLAAAGVIVPALTQTVLYPLATILNAFGRAPMGSDFFALLIGSTGYPIITLPLVLRRLRTLGRSAWEALMVYAALLPNLIATAQIAHFFGSIDMLSDDALDDAIIEGILTIGVAGDTSFIVLWALCSILTLIGIIRLLDREKEDISMPMS